MIWLLILLAVLLVFAFATIIFLVLLLRSVLRKEPEATGLLLTRPPEPSEDLVTYTVAIVSGLYGVTPEEVLGESRERLIVRARHVAMRVVRESSELSYKEIGRCFNRHHTSVLHGCHEVQSLDLGPLIAAVRERGGQLWLPRGD